MEVHHHPKVEKKNFKEYFLEFLMIFLAVTMGFIAENIREDFTERHLEKEYMESLVKDLQLDTAVLKIASDSKEQRYLSIDSVLQYFRYHREENKVPASTLRQMQRSQFDMFFIHHSGTIDQLKNSGALRLIRKKELIDSIESYYQQVQRSESRNSLYFDNQQSAYDEFEKFIDAFDNIKYNQDFYVPHKPYPDSGSVSFNSAYLNEYLNNLVRVRRITFSDKAGFADLLKEIATRLIELIKKEYGFK